MIEIPLTQGKVALIDDENYSLVSPYRWFAHKSRGTKDTYYAYTNIKGKTIAMHRLILGAKPGEEVDHINGDGVDNRNINIRICRSKDNKGNRRKGPGEFTSQYKGVSLNSQTGRWTACISKDGRNIHLGEFSVESDAARAYDKAAKEYFGEFAKANF